MEYRGRKLEFTVFSSKPSFQAEIIGSKLINNEVDKLIRKPTIPSVSHPWRNSIMEQIQIINLLKIRSRF